MMEKAESKRSLVERFRDIGFDDQITLAAQGAALMGAREIMKFHGASQERLRAELKMADETFVTEADKASQEAMLKILTKRLFSVTEVRAEEGERSDTDDQNIKWYIDPLDGTSSFVRGQKVSTVGVAMYEKGEPHTAVICRPFQNELLVARKGTGAFVFPLDDKQKIIGPARPIRVSDRKTLNKGIFYWDGVSSAKSRPPTRKFFEMIEERAGRLGFRAQGTNIGEQAEIALGNGDLKLTTAIGGPYDILVGRLIVEEAGGLCIDEKGLPPNPNSKAVLYGNSHVMEEYKDMFLECYKDYEGFN